jgi:hypothetical protein
VKQKDKAIKAVYQRASKRGFAPLFNILPPHARNTYPYHGEGERGGGIDPETSHFGVDK